MRRAVSTLADFYHILLLLAIFVDKSPFLDAYPQNEVMSTLRKRALDALDGDDFTLERRRRALDGLEGTDFSFRKRALDNLEGDDFGGLKKKRALDALEGDGFQMKRKRALDALEGAGFGLKKRAIAVVHSKGDNEKPETSMSATERLRRAIAALNRQRYSTLLERAIDNELSQQHSKRALDALEGNSFGFRR